MSTRNNSQIIRKDYAAKIKVFLKRVGNNNLEMPRWDIFSKVGWLIIDGFFKNRKLSQVFYKLLIFSVFMTMVITQVCITS